MCHALELLALSSKWRWRATKNVCVYECVSLRVFTTFTLLALLLGDIK